MWTMVSMDTDAKGTAETDAPDEGGRVAELYSRHVPATVGFAYLLTGDRGEAEDLVQEAFVRVIGRLQHLRSPDAFDAYLMRAVVNLRTSRLRRLRTERRYLEREGARRPPIADPPDVERRDQLWHALDHLTPRQRTAIVLRYYEDRSERETADLMRCSVAAVKSMTARAMETLRREIGSADA